MAVRIQWKTTADGLRLLSGSYFSFLKNKVELYESTTLSPALYFSYNSTARQITIMTTELSETHLSMIEHLRKLFTTSSQPEEIVARLLIQWFAAMQEAFATITNHWDNGTTGTVRHDKIRSISNNAK